MAVKKKPKPLKKFKGFLKMPLDTSHSLKEFASLCSYQGDWLTKRKHILANGVKRKWYINVYYKDSQDNLIGVDNITTSTKIDKVALNDLIDIALADIKSTPDVDVTKSYMTVSC